MASRIFKLLQVVQDSFNQKMSFPDEVRVSGYMDILILNTYPARPLSLSMGKKGPPGTHFNGKYQQGMNLIFQWEITS